MRRLATSKKQRALAAARFCGAEQVQPGHYAPYVNAGEKGFSPTQRQILVTITSRGPLTATKLAAHLGVTVPTVSDALLSTAEGSLISNHPDPRHDRGLHIGLTACGRRLARLVISWLDLLA